VTEQGEPIETTAAPATEDIDVASAMAVYSADGQVDDASGGDTAAELLQDQESEQNRAHGFVPEGPA
jgi:hypothetical protein